MLMRRESDGISKAVVNIILGVKIQNYERLRPIHLHLRLLNVLLGNENIQKYTPRW